LDRHRTAKVSGSFVVEYPTDQESAASVLQARSHDDLSQSDPLSPHTKLRADKTSLATAAQRLSSALASDCDNGSEGGSPLHGNPRAKHLEDLAGSQPDEQSPWMQCGDNLFQAQRDVHSLKAQLASSKELDQHYDHIKPSADGLKTMDHHYDDVKPRLSHMKALMCREARELPNVRAREARLASRARYAGPGLWHNDSLDGATWEYGHSL
jgi:hypothetical protein